MQESLANTKPSAEASIYGFLVLASAEGFVLARHCCITACTPIRYIKTASPQSPTCQCSNSFWALHLKLGVMTELQLTFQVFVCKQGSQQGLLLLVVAEGSSKHDSMDSPRQLGQLNAHC